MERKYTEKQIRKIVKKAIEKTKEDIKGTEKFGDDPGATLIELRDLVFMTIFACNFDNAMEEAKKHENNS